MSDEPIRELIARRAAREIFKGACFALGDGIPKLVARFLQDDIKTLCLHQDGQLASNVPIGTIAHQLSPDPFTESFFSSADAFAMIRGGCLDLAILGALQVDERGNLANWMIPGEIVQGMGAAMDLAVGARRVVIAMEHTTGEGRPKILKHCTLPLTALRVVQRIITEVAVIDVMPQELIMREIAPGLTVEEVRKITEAPLKVDRDLKIMQF
ncbi:MAG: CoA-transferase [Acidobacteriota bacterium]